MDRKQAVSGKIHFHIRWAPSLRWDPERFATRETALAQAVELKGPAESFQIVEADETCARCKGGASPPGALQGNWVGPEVFGSAGAAMTNGSVWDGEVTRRNQRKSGSASSTSSRSLGFWPRTQLPSW